MKKLLLFFLVLTTVSCSNNDDDAKLDGSKPSVESVTFTEVFSGSQSNTRLTIKLNIPEEGSVKSVSLLRNTTRIERAIQNPKHGTNTVVDPMGYPSGPNERTYTIILVLQDNSEITSTPYKVQ